MSLRCLDLDCDVSGGNAKSPNRGFFVLEVKDWKLSTIRSANHNGFEILTSPDGKLKRVQNPLMQARDYALEICSVLEKDPVLTQSTGKYKGKLICPYAYGVALPNITRRNFDSQPVLAQLIEPHLVICKDEMTSSTDPGDLQEQLWAMSHYHFGTTLTSEEIDRIRWHLYPELRVSSKQLSFFENEPVEIATQSAIPHVLKVMDLQQELLARSLGDGHRVIHGVAGSGKTLILAYRCKQLAVKHQSVLVLCFNVSLASKLRSLLIREKVESVTVCHFHGWCSDMLKRHHIPRPNPKQHQGANYIKELERTVIKAVESGRIPKGQYGAVMIDEGHDFAPEWLKLIATMVNPKTDSFLLLYDDAQNLYSKATSKKFSFKSLGIKAQGRTTILKLNYRNTVQVLMLAYEFAKDIMQPTIEDNEDIPPLVKPNSAGREGPVPSLVKCPSFEAEVHHVAHSAKQLYEKGVPWNEIAVIYRNHWMGVRIASKLQEAGLPVDWLNRDSDSRRFNASHQSIKLMTMHSSKGLEFPVVFIPGVGYLPNANLSIADEARLLYVAMTRAIEILVLTGNCKSLFTSRLKKATTLLA